MSSALTDRPSWFTMLRIVLAVIAVMDLVVVSQGKGSGNRADKDEST